MFRDDRTRGVDLAMDAKNPAVLYAGFREVLRTPHSLWTDQDYPTAQFYNVITTSHVPHHVWGAQQDNSTACVPSIGSAELYAVGGGDNKPTSQSYLVFKELSGRLDRELARIDALVKKTWRR